MQSTFLQRYFSGLIRRLEIWAANPWRRYSLFIIVFLIGFFLGGAFGMINGVLALMDPIGALITVLLLEIMVRSRKVFNKTTKTIIVLNLLDFFRIGIIYGLFTEALKLL